MLTSINASGQIVGNYDANGQSHGFLLDSGGTITTIDPPGSIGTVIFAINDSGLIAGVFDTSQGVLGFLDSGGTTTTFAFPISGNPIGITASGQIVGTSLGLFPFHGFVDSGGTITTLDVPGSFFTELNGVNASGQIVGIYEARDSSGVLQEHGFLDSGGHFTNIDVPGSYITTPIAINDAGQIVGTYFTLSGNVLQSHGFLDSGGTITTIDVPGSFNTAPLAFNDSGQIVGVYNDANGPGIGFIANPPPIVEAGRSNVQTGGTATANALANDTSPIAKDALIVSAVDGLGADVGQPVAGTFGTLTLNANGSYTYTVNANAVLPADGVGQDVFTYTATYNDSDGPGGTADTTLTFVVTNPSLTYISAPPGGTATAGNGQNPILDGGAGGVTVTAGNGSAVLIGGPGDTLTGGHGSDTFVFTGDFGSNTITNFNPHTSVIQLATSEFADFSVVQNNMTQVGTDTVITDPHNPHDTITLQGIAVSDLHARDFQFV